MSESQHPDASCGVSTAGGLPLIRLCDAGEHVRVLSLAAVDSDGGGGRGAAFQPFGLPPIPKSLTDWLALLGERFREAHGRCIAAVLLLDTRTVQWATAIPAQRCDRHATCWSAARRDFPGCPPHAVVAGSFQTRVLLPGEDAADCPPPHDGLHFVQVAGGPGDGGEDAPGVIWSFVRAAGRTRAVPASDVILDDWQATIEQAMPRLTLG